MKKEILICIFMIMVVAILAGCTAQQEETYTGIIKDTEHQTRVFSRAEKTTILFEDGKTIQIKENSNEYSIHGVYLIAKNNIGKEITITYINYNEVKNIVIVGEEND